MDYQTFPATADFENLINCYWSLYIPKEVPKGQQQILPDGCMDMIFNLGDGVKRIVSDEEFLMQPRSFILGQISKPFFIEPTGLVNTFAVRFNPGCFAYFSKASMADLADKDTELKTLFGAKKIEPLDTAIAAAADAKERIEIVNRFLLELVTDNIDEDDLLKSTIDQICQTKGAITVNEMLQSKQNQRRQLERKFSNQVGLSPKQLCRVIRLQATLKAVLEGEKSLTSVGYENNYFDQAHFIKDFKDFTGVSPKDFYKDDKFTLSALFYSKE